MITKETIEFIRENYSTLGPKECSKILNISAPVATYHAKKMGLKINKENLLKILQKGHNKNPEDFNVNHENLFNIDNTNKAYLLGLLWGDGSVLCKLNQDKNDIITFTSTFPDADEFLSEFIKTGTWKVYAYQPKGHPTWKTRTSFITSNKNISKVLYELNYTNKKLGFDKVFKFIPEKYIHSFLLGLSDSDGSFYFKEETGSYIFSYCSCYEQDWTNIEELLKKMGIDYKIERSRTKSGNYSKLRIVGKSRVKAWGEFLYQSYNEDKIGLKRKHSKYQQICEKCKKWIRKCTLPNIN